MFEIKTTQFFLAQIDNLNPQAKKILEAKIMMLKINPFRNKRIQYKNFFLFRIRLETQKREKRVIYLVEGHSVKLLCMLDRRKDYKDLDKYLKKLGY